MIVASHMSSAVHIASISCHRSLSWNDGDNKNVCNPKCLSPYGTALFWSLQNYSEFQLFWFSQTKIKTGSYGSLLPGRQPPRSNMTTLDEGHFVSVDKVNIGHFR